MSQTYTQFMIDWLRVENINIIENRLRETEAHVNKYQYKQGMLMTPVVGVLLLTGCGGDRESEGYSERVYASSSLNSNIQVGQEFASDESFEGNMELSNGSLHGQVGDVFVNDNAPSIDGYHEQELTSIYIRTEADHSLFAMTILEIHGGVSHIDLAAGETVTYDIVDQYEPTDDETFIQVIGCSGEDPSDWEYDESARTVTISVEEGTIEGHARYQYTAKFVDRAGEGALVTGEFDLAP